MRRDNAYWQRLRKDRRSNAAVLLAGLAALAATLAVISLAVGGSHYQSRANPLYWLLMVPMGWWVLGLASFEARPVRLLKPGLALACGISLVVAVATTRAEGAWSAQAWACLVSILSAGASLFAYNGSLVQREGPAR